VSPSAVPTAEPTSVPTAAPTVGPTLAPTRKPSAAPTVRPSEAPTQLPTVEAGKTQAPLRAPTAAPTLSPEARWRAELDTALQSMAGTQTSAATHRATYYELDVTPSAQRHVVGGCATWKSTLSGDLSSAKLLYRPLYVEVASQEMLSPVGALTSIRCDNRTVVAQMLDALLKPGDLSTYQCGGHAWVVAQCAGSNEAALCVDCADPCSAEAHCCSAGAGSTSPYVVAPCVTTSCSSGKSLTSALRVLNVAYKDFEPAPSIVSLSVVPERTALTAVVQLSGRGTVYCAAYAFDQLSGTVFTPSSDSSIVLQNFVAAVNMQNTSSVVMSGLNAATNYRVYCMSLSPSGTKLALDKVVAQSVSASTTCCIPLTAQAAAGSTKEGLTIPNFLTLTVSARPALEVVLTLSAFTSSGAAVVPSPFFPSTFTVSALQQSTTGTASSRPQSVTLTSTLAALSPDSYTYTVTASGPSAGQYAVSYGSTGNSLVVLPAQSPLPAPVLTSATFADDGSYIAISFDSNTDKGKGATQFTCSSLFQFSCASTSSCLWVSNRVVNAFVSSASGCAAVGSSVSVTSSASVRALCQSSPCDTSAWQPASSGVVVKVASASSAVSPAVSVSAPSTVGGCDSVVLDISGSTGNGGRPWVNQTLWVETTATANATDLQLFLSTKYKASPPTPIPAGLLSKGAAYNFVVKLCNFLGKCSQGSKRVLVQDKTIPTVTLPGAALRTGQRSSVLSIASDAYVVLCGGALSRQGLSYTWRITQAGAPVSLSSVVLKDPSRLRLPAYFLQVGALYDITLQVTILSTLQSSTSAVQVLVTPRNLVAVVAQGLSRSLRVEEPLTIDGSGSRDEDQEGVTGVGAGLSYVWSCAQVEPVLSSTCGDVFTTVSGSATGPTYAVTAKSTAAFAVAQVTMTILDASQSRTAQAVVTVTVQPSLSPVVTIGANAGGNGVINTDRELQLSGTVVFPASYNGTATWSVDDTSNFNFLSALRSPPASFIGASSTPQVNSIYMVLRPNTLPGRSVLTFSLTARTNLGGFQSVASVAVTVNAPPLPGTFAVTPQNGTEIVEPFTFLVSQWYDADLPLQYLFAYVSQSGIEVTVRSRTDAAYGAATLPAGLEQSGFAVSCLTRVFDSLSASASLSYTVKVFKQRTRDTGALSSLITAGLADGAASVDGLKQATSLGTYLLNEVDCSGAPTDCAARNRKECFRTKNTCGGCVSSLYVGDEGDSNDACVLLGQTSTRDDSLAPGECRTAADCSPFELCAAGVCVPQPMPCAANCSYPHGTCRHVDKSSGAPVSVCYVGSTSCSAVCDCVEDYIGSDTCSLNTTELLQKRALRSQVIDGIQQLVNMEDADQQTVEGWIGSVVSVSQASDELSDEGVAKLLTTVDAILYNAASAGVNVDSMAELLKSVDASIAANSKSAARKRRLSERFGGERSSAWRLLSEDGGSSALEQAQGIVAQFRAVAVSNLLPGQDAVEVVLPQFRVLVQKLSLLSLADDLSGASSGGRNVSLSAPRSALEALNGQPANSFTVPTDPNADPARTSLNVALTTLRSELFNTELALTDNQQMFSNPLTVELSDLLCSGEHCRFEMVLQTASALSSYAAVASGVQSFNTTCGAGDTAVHEYTCPDDAVLSVRCGDAAYTAQPPYTVTSRCPVTRYSPACNAVAGLSVSNSTGCVVKASTATNVTCSCPVSGLARRRLQGEAAADDDSTAAATTSVSYVAMLTEVQDNFVDTVVSAQGLNASVIEKGWSALVTIGCVAVAVLFGLHWSYQADAQMDKVSPAGMKDKHGKDGAPAPKRSTLLQRTVRTLNGYRRWYFGRNPGATGSRVHSARAAVTVDKDVLIAEQALPAILRSTSLTSRVKDEMKHHHKWFGIVFFFSRSFPRVLRVLSLATNVIIMLFIQSITYTLTNPDDGTCEALHSEQACLESPSPYATGESKCYWDPTTSQCGLVQPDSDVKVILFVAVFSALLATPLALLGDYLIMYVLSAPTAPVKARSTAVAQELTPIVPAGSVTESQAAQQHQQRRITQRKRSSMTGSVFGSVFGSALGTAQDGTDLDALVSVNAQADLRKLVTGLTAYRETLSAEQKTEFDGETFTMYTTPRICHG
jgi:hypothetical protein